MGGIEDLVILDTNACQPIDIKKTSPVDLVAGATPPGKPIVLSLQQPMQTRPARFCRRVIGGGISRGDLGVVLRTYREERIVVTDNRFTTLLRQADRTRSQRLTVWFAQERCEDLALQRWLAWVPVDIEEFCEPARTPQTEYIAPPRVFQPARLHMVGHNIDNQSHPTLAQRGDHVAQAVLAAEFRIYPRRIRDVIAMHRPGPRRQDWRHVEMADAETRSIGHQTRCTGKGEVLMQLQPHGCAHAHKRGRLCASVAMREAASGSSNKTRASGARRRRQFGCSSMVPGKFGCSSMPRTSSIGGRIRGEPVAAVNTSAASTTGGVLSAGGSALCAAPLSTKARHSARRSTARSSAASVSLTPTPSRLQAARVVMSLPRHQPATVGRSCVDVMPTALRSHAPGGANPRSMRSNHSTRIPCSPAAARVSRKPSGTVPRSSPTTIARCRCDSSASRR